MIGKTVAGFSELSGPAEVVAQRLLGAELIRTFPNGERVTVKIVETEAYDQTDAASHSCKHRTPRTEIMFGPAGFLYVYFTYGMHYCMNIVCGAVNEGSAVLIRAVEPVDNSAILSENRAGRQGIEISNGPAKACQALMIDKALNKHNLQTAPFQLKMKQPIDQVKIVQTTRIGITKAKDTPWRYYIKGNPYVSKL